MVRNESGTLNGVESSDEKRAVWEQFRFTVCPNGYVNVENLSYGDESGDHIYSVEVSNGSATGCSCPHATYRDAHCKHQHAVEQAPIVVSSASAASVNPTVATDGGQVTEHEHDSPKVTIHREPEGVGGALYGRCENCGVECVADHDGHISILHEKSCPGDSNPDEIDETPL
jgi:hypothetical protein